MFEVGLAFVKCGGGANVACDLSTVPIKQVECAACAVRGSCPACDVRGVCVSLDLVAICRGHLTCGARGDVECVRYV